MRDVLLFPKDCCFEDAFYASPLMDLSVGAIFTYPDSLVGSKLKNTTGIQDKVYNIPDLNDDGAITAADAQLELQIALDEQSGIVNELRYRATDFNQDGKITALEAQFILTYYINNILMEDEYLSFFDIVPKGYLGKKR